MIPLSRNLNPTFQETISPQSVPLAASLASPGAITFGERSGALVHERMSHDHSEALPGVARRSKIDVNSAAVCADLAWDSGIILKRPLSLSDTIQYNVGKESWM
jgi:hypothetical protein